jgi:hypothetical protein
MELEKSTEQVLPERGWETVGMGREGRNDPKNKVCTCEYKLKKRKEREKKRNVIKCLEAKEDETFNILLQLCFYVLKIKSK